MTQPPKSLPQMMIVGVPMIAWSADEAAGDAVAEAAAVGQVRHVGEGGVDALAVQQLQLAHSRRVDQQSPSGKQVQLAVRGGVAAATVTQPHLPGGRALLAQQGVGDGRGLCAGKAGKPIEFGHMVLFAQASEKFITDFVVLERNCGDNQLLSVVLERHQAKYGRRPKSIAADKGFSPDAETYEDLEEEVDGLRTELRIMRGFLLEDRERRS